LILSVVIYYSKPDYTEAARSGFIGFSSDLILGPLNDAASTLKNDIARIFSAGILNLGGHEFIRNTPQNSTGGSLPSTVQQNGTTYIRNSSGLLNVSE